MVACVALPTSAGAFFRIDHAFVPGIGRVGTTLPTDTRVRPPGFIPDARPHTNKEFNEQARREGRIHERVQPGPDSGPPSEIRRAKRQVVRDLFLIQASNTCEPLPKAGLWVYRYAHAPPGRQVYMNRYETNRRLSQDDGPVCAPVRLRLDKWLGVRIDGTGTRARLMARGAFETDWGSDGTWKASRTIWRIAARLKDDRWRVAVNAEELPDEPGD